MFVVSPFLIVMSTSSFLNAKIGATFSGVKIAGPIMVIVVGVLSILDIYRCIQPLAEIYLQQYEGFESEMRSRFPIH